MDNKSIGCSCHQRELSLQDRLEKVCRSEDALLKEVARLKCEMGGARATHEVVVRLKKENQKLKENMTGILDTIYDNPNNPKTTGTYDLLGDIGDIVEEILKLKENSDCHYSDEELHNSSDEETVYTNCHTCGVPTDNDLLQPPCPIYKCPDHKNLYCPKCVNMTCACGVAVKQPE